MTKTQLPAGFFEAYRPRTHALFLAATYVAWASLLLALSLGVLMANQAAAATAAVCSCFFVGLAFGARWHLMNRGPAAAYRLGVARRARLVRREGVRVTVVVREKGQTQIVPALDWLFDAQTCIEDGNVWVCVGSAGDGLIVPSPPTSEVRQLTA